MVQQTLDPGSLRLLLSEDSPVEDVQERGEAGLVAGLCCPVVAPLVFLPPSPDQVLGLHQQWIVVQMFSFTRHTAPTIIEVTGLQLFKEFGEVRLLEKVMLDNSQSLLILN